MVFYSTLKYSVNDLHFPRALALDWDLEKGCPSAKGSKESSKLGKEGKAEAQRVRLGHLGLV